MSAFASRGKLKLALEWDAWLGPIRREYLETFIPEGGAAVQFVVAAQGRLAALTDDLAAAARAAGLTVILVDTAAVRLNLLQGMVFAIAGQLDWDGLIQARLEQLVAAAGYRWPNPGRRMTIEAVAAGNAIAAPLLRTTMQRHITSTVWDDAGLAQDFRRAMITLLDANLVDDQDTLRDAVMAWLLGELRSLRAVRDAQIGARIGRQNARAMLVSLCRWVRGCGLRGIVVLLDLRQVLLERREVADGLAYSPAAVMDCYEVLRQVIDDAEQFEGLMLVAFSDPRLVNDNAPRRALSQYTALKMRVWDDVRPHEGDNPLAPLVMIA